MKKIIIILITLMVSTSVFAETIKVRVSSSEPIHKQSRVKIPYTSYEEERVQIPYDCGGRVDRNSIGLDTVIGTVLGVAIGNQIGGGSGREIARVVGGIGGAHVANQNRHSGETCYTTETRSKPVTRYETEVRERIVGYKNCGYLGSHKICKTTKHKQRKILVHY